VKCPEGVSSYHSNFTFGQNQADPWNPNSANRVDSLVQQQQNIALSSCAKFSVMSDGTKEGTRLGDGGLDNGNTCPRVQETPIPMNGIAFWKNPSLIQRPHAGQTGMPHILQSNSGTRGGTSKTMLFLTILIVLLAMLPGAHASPENHEQDKLRERAEWHIREVSDRVRLFAQDFGSDLAEQVTAQGLNGDAFAHNLVADVVSSVCTEYFKGAKQGEFTPAVVQNCVKSVYSGDSLALPAVQFSAVFGASLLCDYIVSEAYPVAHEFFSDGCDSLQELARRVLPETSAMMSKGMTSVSPQSSRSETRASNIVQPPGSKQTEAAFESPMHSSVNALSGLTPSFSPTGLMVENQASSHDMDSATNSPLENPATSKPTITRSPTPRSSSLVSVSVSTLISPVVSRTPSPKSSAIKETTPASRSPSLLTVEGTPHDITQSISSSVPSASRSLVDTSPDRAMKTSQSASVKAPLDLSPVSQSMAPSNFLLPSLRKESSASVRSMRSDNLLIESQFSTTYPKQASPPRTTARPASLPKESSASAPSMLSDSLLMKSQYSTAYSEQISPLITIARPASQGTGSIQSASLSFANTLNRSMNVLAIASYTLPSESRVSTSRETESSSIFNIATSSLPRTAPSSVLGDDPNAVSIPTVQSSGRAPIASTVPSPRTTQRYHNSTSTITITPTPKPTWQTNTPHPYICPGAGCTKISKSMLCDGCQSSSHDSVLCSSTPCLSPDSKHVLNTTSKFSATYHSSTTEDLPTMLYSSTTSASVLTVTSIPGESTTPVQSTNSSGLGPSSVTTRTSSVQPMSQSLAEKPTTEAEDVGGLIAKGFEGWW
jgi:hypothetical protein